jgi:Histidine kinase-, DNA gyrase B-, and HSP90-like ATPase
MTDIDPGVVSGLVDADGRLISADPRLLALQLSAEGAEGGLFAVPQLASLARLCLTLQTVISRSVIVAEGNETLTLWVRAVPSAEDARRVARLSLTGWSENQSAQSQGLTQGRSDDLNQLVHDGSWACDARLMLTELSPAPHGKNWLGKRLTTVFHLDEVAEGEVPLIDAALDRKGCEEQRSSFRDDPASKLTLFAVPKLDEQGRFDGFSGHFRWAGSTPEWAQPTVEPAASPYPLESQLEGALRDPLHRIIAQADSLIAGRQDGLQDVYVGYAGDIAAAGRHLLGLVDDLSDLQTVERDGFSIANEPVDLADVSRRAAGLLGVRAANAGVRIDVPDTDETLMAEGDFRRLLQIMVNLIGNAVRYSPEGAQVWVRTEVEGDLAAVIVADQGKGIAPADHDLIFEKFGRVDHSEPGGTGLGLYISRKLARAMGGDISVDSAPGRGARFVLTLPAAAPAFPD